MGTKHAHATSGLRVAVSGALGRMGSTTCRAVIDDSELLLAAAIDPVFAEAEEVGDTWSTGGEQVAFSSLDAAVASTEIDVVVDFSIPAVVKENVRKCIEHHLPVVVGTTGLNAADLAELDREAAEKCVPVLVAPNFAMGAVLMMQFAEQASKHFDACEIIELHHEAKLDSPSGTARLTGLRVAQVWRDRGLDKEAPIHSVRLPGLVAHQEVIFGGVGETLTIRHDSLSRESFMPGVLLAVKRVRTLQGLVVGLENIL